jgi:hypothetical protein
VFKTISHPGNCLGQEFQGDAMLLRNYPPSKSPSRKGQRMALFWQGLDKGYKQNHNAGQQQMRTSLNPKLRLWFFLGGCKYSEREDSSA